MGNKIWVKITGSCLKQDESTYAYKTIVNISIVCKINKNHNISSYPTLKHCFFEVVKLTKNFDISEYRHSGYGIRFKRKETFSIGKGFGRSCMIFAVDMSYSAHDYNKKINILILYEGHIQGLGGSSLTAEKIFN